MFAKKLYGLIGYPLSHSFSAKYFAEKFQRENITGAEYRNFEIEKIQQLTEILESNPNLIGFNVTIPYKEVIIPYLDELDADAQKIGAVNTVRVLRDGCDIQLKGFNTDFYGFSESLKEFLYGSEKKALVFGNGGAAKAVIYSLQCLGVDYYIVTRSSDCNDPAVINYKNVTEKLIKESDLLVNTTPLGMWPNIMNSIDIPYDAIKQGTIAYDLIYNPEETMFMKKSKENGAIVVNGLRMLELQAEKAWEFFNSYNSV
ncbi:MAG: shikimate dehydrogenase [Chloroflexia bacterium]|nr:shikimate dehydrogenase [Chloroflexia bacterium]